jgi:hypothetical protein
MKKTGNSNNFFLSLAAILVVAGFIAISFPEEDLTGFFSQENGCRLVEDPFSHKKYCKGIKESKFCVWHPTNEECRFVTGWQTCHEQTKGLCPRPKDSCIKESEIFLCKEN